MRGVILICSAFAACGLGVVALGADDYLLQPGDVLTVEVDPASNRVMGLTVVTYLDNPKDAVTLDVRFSSLQDGTGYPATQALVAKAKNLSVDVTNSGYRKLAQ